VKQVLVLGAGLLALPDIDLRLATLNIDRARDLLAGRPRGRALEINAHDQGRMAREVAAAQVVVSLLPADQHVQVAEACLAQRVPLITTSYISDGMRALDDEARARGVLLLNECGFDPGIDHMTAVQLIRRLHREGAAVRSFASYGGAIPAPEANTNPWGYKFTWSPRGVVVAARNPVRYLENGLVVERTFPDLFRHPREVDVPGVGRLEAYPNRDCLRYVDAYELASVQSLFRGSLRYRGWCDTWRALFDLGLLDLEPRCWSGLSYAQFLERHLGGPDDRPLVARVAARLGCSEDDEVVARLEWLGLLSDRRLPETTASSLDVLTDRLQRMLQYRPGERDLALLEHHFEVVRSDGRERRLVSRLMLYGHAGDDSALARTVSYPAAVACRLILDGRVTLSGVQIPIDPQLTLPILLGLDRRGLHVHEYEEDVDMPGQ
jgi:saccharopine dehydrogenase (NADP+, L-glutamate forming)